MSYRKYNVGIGGIRAEMKKMGRPKSDNAKKKVLSIRVPDQLYSQMLAYAKQHKMNTTDTVSYTHLDVYKRQSIYCKSRNHHFGMQYGRTDHAEL